MKQIFTPKNSPKQRLNFIGYVLSIISPIMFSESLSTVRKYGFWISIVNDFFHQKVFHFSMLGNYDTILKISFVKCKCIALLPTFNKRIVFFLPFNEEIKV